MVCACQKKKIAKAKASAIVRLIFVFVEEEVFFGGIIRPNVFDGLKNLAFVFKFIEIFYYFHRRARTHCIVNEFFLGGWPRCVFKF